VRAFRLCFRRHTGIRRPDLVGCSGAVTGIGVCPALLPPVIGDGTVDIEFRNNACPILVPSPSEFTLYSVIEPLPAGSWLIRLVVDENNSLPLSIVDSQGVIVSHYSVEVSPSPAEKDDPVTALLAGFGFCAFPDEPLIEPGRIRLRVTQFPGPCDPPVNNGPFSFEIPLGQLPAGNYEVEFFLEGHPRDHLVAETTLQVLPIGDCEPDENTLCLTGQRFQVNAEWQTEDGESAFATAVPATFDTGLFWFFDDSNIELVVKVLDACDTAFNSFWVFAGGLTDVGVGISVVDTQTGESVVYLNPVGQAFAPITDTAAFSTCP